MVFLVKQENDAVHFEYYRSTREAFTSKLEEEAAKKVAKDCLERSKKRKKSAGKAGADCK